MKYALTLSVLLFFLLILSCTSKKSKLINDDSKLNTSFQNSISITPSIYDTIKNLLKPSTQKWLKQEDSISENYFAKNSTYNSYLSYFEKLQSVSTEQNRLIKVSETLEYFYVRRDTVNGGDKIYHEKSINAQPVEIFDTNIHKLSEVVYLSPSYNSKILAIGFESGNGFTSDIIFYDLENKTLLKDKITNINTDYGEIQWLPDSTGFIYLYFPIVDKELKDFKNNSYSTLHILGKSKSLLPIYGNLDNLKIPSNFYPKIKISSSTDKYAIGYEATTDDFYSAHIISIEDITNGKLDWKPFYEVSDSIYFNLGIIKNDIFYFKKIINGSAALCSTKISKPDFENVNIIYQGNEEIQLNEFELTQDYLYYSTSKYGSEVALYKSNLHNDHLKIKLPFTPGYLNFLGASITHNFIGVGIDGWTSSYKRFIVGHSEELIPEDIRFHKDYPKYNGIETKQFMAKSYDQTEIPLTIIVNKNFKFDSSNEVLLYVYGAYGESISPYFEPMLLEWVSKGGVLAFAHVRGGGEKGKNWHIQGMKNLKYNSWKDLIACAEFLKLKKISNDGLISLYTSSAGGITAAMAINERPELFSSFIADVPRLNPYDLELDESLSSTSYIEYGSIKDSLEVKGLKAMDPFLNIRGKQNYPATLIMASYLDDRIPLWDNAKYILKLRDSSETNNPILFDIDYESGHSDYSSPYALYYSRLLSFAKSNMRR